jgi:putative Ca2+/H+ antiporter (TMEM165/GDT1 family)
MRKPELCLGFISSSCVHKDEQWPEPVVMAMARLCSSPPRRILVFILLVFLLAFVPFSAGQMSSHAEDDEAGDATVVRTENESYHRRSKLLVNKDDVLPKTQGGEDEVEVKEGWGGGGVVYGGGEGFTDATFTSLSMILVSEIGDETFIIAALMAMRHPRSIVLSGALSALVIMTVLSTGLGRIVPNLISRKHTNNAATVLYTFFGLRLLYIAWRADPNSTPQKELEEVEEKLEGTQKKTLVRRLFARFCTPIFLESFILTFLAEWGDRSQIATIALAAHKNPWGVTLGATMGHTVCTSLAVVGGRLLALKISQRTVATVGGCLFMAFAMSSYFYPPV